ncbi:type I restriction-modification system subunit M N-terminal domain-containing protein [Candidatus Desulforudis audaxviator]|nr:type I restriction-modification system subunit M N-terminal domain-containing protein [Candidatus Desulforudis audaxviator]
MNNFGEKVAFIWSVADLLRGPYRPNQYKDVLLPMTVLRRLDCVLEPTKDQVLEKIKTLQESKVKNFDPSSAGLRECLNLYFTLEGHRQQFDPRSAEAFPQVYIRRATHLSDTILWGGFYEQRSHQKGRGARPAPQPAAGHRHH